MDSRVGMPAVGGDSTSYEDSFNRLYSEAAAWKKEKARLKDLLKMTTADLKEKALSLSALQASLADALIAKTGDDTSAKAKHIHKLAVDLKERLVFCETQLKALREERDNYVLDISVLEGKMATCTLIAEEQDDFIKSQLDTIRKLETKVQVLQSNLQETESDDKEERSRLQEQLSLHQQRAALQDKKIKKLQHDLEVTRLQLCKVETRESVLEEQLETQTNICQETTRELRASTKEIEKLSDTCADLREQQERMEQTWSDNARLVQLLASVDEYRELVTEIQEGRGLVYMPPSSKGARFQRLTQRYGCCKTQIRSVNVRTEPDQWIPAEAYDMLMAFRKQCCPSIPVLVFHELLADLSYFWRDRVKRQTALMRRIYEKRIMDLKRQLLQRIPYGQVVPTNPIKPLRRVPRKPESRISYDGQSTTENDNKSSEFLPVQVFYNVIMDSPSCWHIWFWSNDATSREEAPQQPIWRSTVWLTRCRELGNAIVAYGPLGRGFFAGYKQKSGGDQDFRKYLPRMSGDNRDKNEKLREKVGKIAEKKCSVNQLALAWVHHKGKDVRAISGTTKRVNLESNIEALGVTLTTDEMAEIEAAVLYMRLHLLEKSVSNKLL